MVPSTEVQGQGRWKNLIFLRHQERCTTRFSSLSCLIPNCHESPTEADAAAQVRGNSSYMRGICTCWWHQNSYLQQAVHGAADKPDSFTQENGLTLNPQKCEVVVMSQTKHPKEVVGSIDQQQSVWDSGAWSWNLAAKTAVDEAVKNGCFPRRPAWTHCQEEPYLKCVWFQLLCMAVKVRSWQKIWLTLESFQEGVGR